MHNRRMNIGLLAALFGAFGGVAGAPGHTQNRPPPSAQIRRESMPGWWYRLPSQKSTTVAAMKRAATKRRNLRARASKRA